MKIYGSGYDGVAPQLSINDDCQIITLSKGGQITRPDPIRSEKFEFGLDSDEGSNSISDRAI